MTLRALLGARIDALDEEAKTALRVASVIGVTFEAPLVDEVLDDASSPRSTTASSGASLIARLDARTAGASRTRSSTTPRTGPARQRPPPAARARRRSPRGEGGARIGVVARHRAAAEDVERAVPLLVRAAEEAAAVGALAEAASFWTAAADLEGAGAAADEYRQRARAALDAVPAGRSASRPPRCVDRPRRRWPDPRLRRRGRSYGTPRSPTDVDGQPWPAGDRVRVGGAGSEDRLAVLRPVVDEDGLGGPGPRAHVERLVERQVAARWIVLVGGS